MKKIILPSVCILICVFLSKAQWTQPAGPCGGQVYCLTAKSNVVLAGTQWGGMYRSDNNGTSWVPVNSGLEVLDIRSLCVSGQNFVAGANKDIYISTNNGDTWVKKTTGITSPGYIEALTSNGTNIFAGFSGNGIARSTDGGTSWTLLTNGLTDKAVKSLLIAGTKVFAGTNAGGIFVSTDNGNTWSASNNGINSGHLSIRSFVVLGSNIFAAAYPGGVYKSSDNGATWTLVYGSIAGRHLGVFGTTLFVSTDNGIYRSTDNGTTWTIANTGVPHIFANQFAATSTTLIVSVANRGICTSTNNGDTWSVSNTGLLNTSIKSFCKVGTTLYAGAYYSGAVFNTSNGGNTWNTTYPSSSYVVQVVNSGTNLYIGTYGSGIFKSTDNGANWTALASNPTNLNVFSIAFIGSNMFAGTGGGGAFVSSNDGGSWAAINNGLTNNTINMLTPSGTTLFAATQSGAFKTTDNGANWTTAGLAGKNIITLKLNNNKLYAGTWGDGVYVSSDNGANWTQINSGITTQNKFVYALAFDTNNNIYVAVEKDIFVSKDAGTSWIAKKIAVNGYVFSIEVLDNYVYAGVECFGVWKRPITEMLTSVDSNLQIPETNLIESVYPNPASDRVNIKYNVEGKTHVLLKVYNVLGAEVTTLVDGIKQAGSHTAMFDAASENLTDGTYFIRLVINDVVETDKIILKK